MAVRFWFMIQIIRRPARID